MKKCFFSLMLVVLSVFGDVAFAIDIDSVFEDNITLETLAFDDYPEINRRALLFSQSGNAISLDYSLLDGVLTVEVENETEAKQYSLIIAEYNAADALVNIHIVRDAKSQNVIGTVHGEYEKCFLWDFTNMCPACPSISTKTDYSIIEGTDGEWEVSPDGHMLYAYLGKDKNVTIPNSYHGKLITAIYNQPAIFSFTSKMPYSQLNMFDGRNDIESFVIPEGIARIGPFAFYGCKASCPLTLPSTLTFIGNSAFRNCKNLTGDVNLQNITTLQESGGYQFAFCTSLNGNLTLPCIETVPKGAFRDCKNLSGEINIPNGVKKIDDNAFACDDRAKFTSLTLPETLEWIGMGAFQYQTGIKNELVLPEELKHIGDAAFNHCVAIPNTKLTIPSSLESIGGDYADSNGTYINTGYGCHVFYDSFKRVSSFEVASDSTFFKAMDGVLYSKDGTRLIAYPPAKSDNAFTVPDGVVQIDEMAFGFSKFNTLTLPDSYVISETVPANVINNMANTIAVAMYHYNALKTVLVKDTNPKYTSINGMIYSSDKSLLWYVPPKITEGEVVIEDGCTRMMQGACWMEANDYNGEIYTSISIPKSVSEINENTMQDLNRKINNSNTNFVINIDSENSSFTVNESRKIIKIIE